MTLPEKLRRMLERTVGELAAQENVYGVGLFGVGAEALLKPQVMLIC